MRVVDAQRQRLNTCHHISENIRHDGASAALALASLAVEMNNLGPSYVDKAASKYCKLPLSAKATVRELLL